MQVAEFVEETARIEKYYEKELDEFQRKVWYQELKRLEIQRYRQVILQAFRQCRFMPKLAEIVEIEKQLPRITQQTSKESVECSKCGGKGVIIYKKIISDITDKMVYTYGARCSCQNGLNFMAIPSAEQLGV